jgi:FKBP-type peptidyl-prolyl cis-trans isomerase SlyD
VSNADQVVAEGKVVTFHYTLTNPEGDVIDTSRTDGEPMPYLHGAQNIVPGLEKQMEGKKVGDKFVAQVEPAEGYGEKLQEGIMEVPREAFPAGMPLEVGMQFVAQGPNGMQMPVTITKVGFQNVTVDANHPLAGVALTFDIEITDIRDASSEEVAHGHVHGPGGHHHH